MTGGKYNFTAFNVDYDQDSAPSISAPTTTVTDYYCQTLGATRMEEVKVVEIACTES